MALALCIPLDVHSLKRFSRLGGSAKMNKIFKAITFTVLMTLIVTPVLAAGLWMGVTWNDPFGSSSENADGNLEVFISSCYTTSCWGAAHYNTPVDFRAADTPAFS